MPIRPVEIIQSQGASQYQHIESQRMIHQQIQTNQNFQDLIKQEQTKTKEPTKTENHEYRYDAKEKGNNRYYGSGNKKKNKEESKEEKKRPPQSGGRIDILI